MKRVAVFCSANPVVQPSILGAVDQLTEGMAARSWELLYGGARSGLMGYLADRMLARGGVVRGAITESLAEGSEGLHAGLHEAVIVKDLFERKRWFLEQAEAFVILPGGFGTLDEALEVITWKAIGYHSKPIVFVNIDRFWQHQLQTFEELARQGMIRSGGLELYRVCDSLDKLWIVLEGAA